MSETYNADSTADQVLEGRDLDGKRIVVTGVSAGLGAETARALVAHGATVIGTARDLAKARSATSAIDPGLPGSLALIEMDLASLASVRRCAGDLIARREAIDVVICNAGVMACPEGRTADGFETQFGTNHLGHFLFVNRIASRLGPGSRVVVLSSVAHRRGDVDLDDPNYEQRPYDSWAAYSASKTANVLFAVEFDRRHRDDGIRAAAVHPGTIHTELNRHMPPGFVETMSRQMDEQQKALGQPPMRWKTIPQGAATSVWAAVVADNDAIGGHYCEDCHVAEVLPDGTRRRGVIPFAVDPDRAELLWAKSEQLVGERF